MTKILIADDHPVIRRGLRQILDDVLSGVVLGEAATGEDALEQARNQEWTLVILDLALPGKSGLDVLKELKRSHPRLPVLVLSMYPEDQFAVRALRAGAAGYMTKESAPEELVEAVRKVLLGGKYVSHYLAERLALHLDPATDIPLHETLSDREYHILLRIASGKSIKEIAYELTLSPKTVGTYRERILRKMRMKSNAELIHYAMRNALVD